MYTTYVISIEVIISVYIMYICNAVCIYVSIISAYYVPIKSMYLLHISFIEYVGLKAMGDQAKAGCPRQNIQNTLDFLTNNDISIAVYEELPYGETKEGKKETRKTRVFSQIVSPLRKTYVYGFSLRSDDIEYYQSLPIIGIMETSRGFTMFEVYIDEKTVLVSDRLTYEALDSMLRTNGFTPPIYLQVCFKMI